MWRWKHQEGKVIWNRNKSRIQNFLDTSFGVHEDFFTILSIQMIKFRVMPLQALLGTWNIKTRNVFQYYKSILKAKSRFCSKCKKGYGTNHTIFPNPTIQFFLHLSNLRKHFPGSTFWYTPKQGGLNSSSLAPDYDKIHTTNRQVIFFFMVTIKNDKCSSDVLSKQFFSDFGLPTLVGEDLIRLPS